MANYETLADGGHEHLIATVKPLVDQKANAHDIDVSVKELVENQPRGHLTGEILTTSHAYDMPPVSVTVEGKSTQVTTTGKNLAPVDRSDYTFFRCSSSASGTIVASGGTAQRGILIPVEPGESLTLSHRELMGGYFKWCDGPIEVGSVISGGATISNYTKYTLTNSDDTTKNAIFFFHNSVTPDFAIDRMQIERGAVSTAYEPYTGGKASPSPDWPQPIVSADAPSILVFGRNLIDPALVEQGTIGSKKEDAPGDTRCRVAGSFDLNVLAGSTVTCTGSCTGGTFQWILSHFVGLASASSGWLNSGASYTIPPEAENIRMLFRRSDDTAVTPADFSNIQLELGSTATEYEPYVGTTVTLPVTLRSLPDGTKDELALSYLRPSTREGWAWYSGEVTRRITEVTFDGSETWKGPYSYTSGAGYYTNTKLPNNIKNRTHADAHTCNLATGANGGGSGANTFYFGGAREVNFVDVSDAAPTLADWVALVTATPAVIQYALDDAYITTETLDPIELPHMPLGDVTIWSDPTTGLTVNYIVEGKAIEETLETGIANALGVIATVETSPTTYNHAVGSRIVYDEVLYRVTSAIASGEDIVPGTNVEATTVTDEIKRLQQ